MKRLLIMVSMLGCGGGGWQGGAPPNYAMGGESVSSAHTYALTPESQQQDTRQDNLATFSLDVDTASYTRMRRALAGGALPEAASVRAEEYINFFRWSDVSASRQSDAPFSARLESAPSPFGAPGAQLLRIGVQAMDVPAAQRPPANVVFLVDTSGSMNGPGKMPLVRFALTTLVNSLQPTDTVGIVTYASSVGTLIEPTPVAQRGALLAAIDSMGAGGSTNGEGGIRQAYDLAAQHFQEGGINRVVLASDGDFNVGLTGDALIELIERFRDRDITLTTLGFGVGNDRDMERLADHGNGMYAFLDTPNEALRVLQDNLGGTLQVVAKDVKVQVEFDPEIVASFRLIGYDNRILAHHEFEDDAVDAGDVGSGQFATAYFEYTLREGVQASPSQVFASVRVRYKAPDGDESQLVQFETRLSETHPRFESASPVFRFGAAVAEFAEILRGSEFSSDARFEEVREIAAAATWSQGPDAAEFLELVSRAEELSRLGPGRR